MSRFVCRAVLLPVLLSLVLTPALGADEEFLRDPTAPLNFVRSENNSGGIFDELGAFFDNYKLTSVLIRAEDKTAVISNRRVRVGDTIGQAHVMEIDRNTVTLDVDGESRILELYGNSVKSLATSEK